MDRETATELIGLYLAAGQPLNRAMAAIAKLPDRDEQARLRRPIGALMSAIYVDLIRPIVREDPDLDPDAPRSENGPDGVA